jgi:regulator of protease activity HflC (stomatin/prohibitin superfamily)
MCYETYATFRIDVPQGHIAVLVKKTGLDLEDGDIIAPDEKYKGIQRKVLTEGRYFYNPWNWSWAVHPMIEIPAGKMGVRVRLYGNNLPYAHFLAVKEDQKGIVDEVLRPGRYPINGVIKGQEATRKTPDYVEIIELFDPITIPAGYRGVVTNLAGPMPENPNVLLVQPGYRGVQEKTLDAGTNYLNPYMSRVNLIDCRSQRFNLSEDGDMGFPSKDGFWVSLDGIVEFRVKPEKAAEVLVVYNELADDADESSVSAEIVRKIVMPNARSFCRLRGSNNVGRDFIGGETRTAFQKDFAVAMQEACDKSGIEIVQALITRINPPQAIAGPVRDREIARQQLAQYKEQVLQQGAEAKLAVEKAMIKRRQELIAAEQSVAQNVTKAQQEQQVAITKANELLVVAERDLEASKDQAAAMLARKKADAGVIEFENMAEAAGWKKTIEALGGDGQAYAQFVLLQKLAPAYKQIMSNTADSPLMDIFKNFDKKPTK